SSTNATNGEFTDHIGVGCNSVGVSCGYDITKQYLWCPLRRAALPIGTYSGYTHSNAISVAGVVSPPDSMSAGTRIDPLGTAVTTKLAVLICVFVLIVYPQHRGDLPAGRGAVQGEVMDQNGHPLSGIRVYAERQGPGG